MNPSDGVQILKSSKQILKNTINVDKEFAQRHNFKSVKLPVQEKVDAKIEK